MSVRRWVYLSIASLVFVGYVGQPTQNQAAEGPTSVTINSPVQRLRSDAIAQTMNATTPVILKSGNFASGEHPTQGTARIINQNGKLFLELDQGFKTSSLGPDLVVVLHRSNNVFGSTKPPSYPLKAGSYVVLAPLRKFTESQRYAIPASIDLAKYHSAVIWCRKFNATFGVAKLVGQ